MKILVASVLFTGLATAVGAGGLADVTDVQVIIDTAPVPSDDWVVLALLAAVIAAVASN